MSDDLVERLDDRSRMLADDSDILSANLFDEARDRITTVTARLAELERATPEEVVEMARKAVTDECGSQLCSWLDLGTQRVCSKDAGHGFCMCETVATAVIYVIAAPLRAQGTAQERERCAQIADSFGRDLPGLDALRIAARIRAGGSGG